jgi:hypothetical protein
MGKEINLKHFTPSELILTHEQACQVLRFFWPDIPPYPLLPSFLNDADCCFAQALLVAAIDSSYEMKQTENIFNSFFMKIPDSFGSIKDMVKDFLKEAAKDWFEHAKGSDLDHPRIYENVRNQMMANFRSVWEDRLDNGTLTY